MPVDPVTPASSRSSKGSLLRLFFLFAGIIFAGLLLVIILWDLVILSRGVPPQASLPTTMTEVPAKESLATPDPTQPPVATPTLEPVASVLGTVQISSHTVPVADVVAELDMKGRRILLLFFATQRDARESNELPLAILTLQFKLFEQQCHLERVTSLLITIPWRQEFASISGLPRGAPIEFARVGNLEKSEDIVTLACSFVPGSKLKGLFRGSGNVYQKSPKTAITVRWQLAVGTELNS